jgi:limonene-1,2-epoxide hydrolase
MSDPVQVVTRFIDTINEGPDGFAKAVAEWFVADSVWENVGMSTTTGPDQALGVMESMAAGGVSSIRIENLAVAGVGRTVLTERVDYMLGADGATRMEVRCMGAFEVNEAGKIVRWTDYFDTAAFRPKA